MKEKSTSFAARALLFLAVAAFICAVASPLLAQRGSTGPTDLRDLSRREQQQSTLERETQRKRDPKQILAEINEDMGRLKVLGEALSTHAAAADQHLNYKSIVESTTEIKNRSVRLRTDLVLPQGEKDQNQAAKKEIGNGPYNQRC